MFFNSLASLVFYAEFDGACFDESSFVDLETMPLNSGGLAVLTTKGFVFTFGPTPASYEYEIAPVVGRGLYCEPCTQFSFTLLKCCSGESI